MSTPGSDLQTPAAPAPAPATPASAAADAAASGAAPEAAPAPPAQDPTPSGLDRATALIEGRMASRTQEPPQEPAEPGAGPGTPEPGQEPPPGQQAQQAGEPGAGRDPLVSDLINRLNGADSEIQRLRQAMKSGGNPEALQQGSVADRLQRVGLTPEQVIDFVIDGDGASTVPGLPQPGGDPPQDGQLSPQFMQFMQQQQTLIQQLTEKVDALESGHNEVRTQMSTKERLTQVSSILSANPDKWPRIYKAIESGNFQPLYHALDTQQELQKRREAGDYMVPTTLDVALDGVEGVLRQQAEYYRSLEPQQQSQQQPPQQQQQAQPQQQPPQAAGGTQEPQTLSVGGAPGGTPTPRKLTNEERLQRAVAKVRENQQARAARGGPRT